MTEPTDLAVELAATRKRLRDFVSMVSHELRTPLTSIRWSLALLASGGAGDLSPDARELVEIAERNAVRLVDLVGDVVDLYRLDDGQSEIATEPVWLAGALDRAQAALEPLLAERRVSVVVDAGESSVQADRARFNQLLEQLLANAARFSPPGGAVTIQVVDEPGWVLVRVIDQGAAIPEGQEDAVFEPFRRGERGSSRHAGTTGAGLALARAIVRRHGGTIGASSRAGEGTVFWFRLPDASQESGTRN
jgi:signal transduction histidine kinase